jgi:two-component system chemotaxis sensor kinase CheA
MPDDILAELLGDFLLESRERLARLEEVLLDLPQAASENRDGMIETARRELHTLKGNCGMMGYGELQALAHELEDSVEQLRAGSDVGTRAILEGVDRFRALLLPLEPESALEPAPEAEPVAESSVRVPLRRLDRLADLTAELVILRNRLGSATAAALPSVESAAEGELAAWEDVEEARRGLEKRLDRLQEEVLELRMVPLRGLFNRMRRLVHDEAAKAGKEVRLVARGERTPLDRSLIEFAGEALGHLVRNAVIHGIESPERRRDAGKSAAGTVLLDAAVRSGEVHIEVVDDGGGIDRPGLTRAARRAGVDPADLTGLHDLLFLPGLSTREQADLSAGRGIGLTAVLESAHAFGGAIDVSTVDGVGTRFRLRLPLSVSIAQALLLEVGGEEYALPVAPIVETVSLDGLTPGGAFEWRGRELPLLDLAAVFDAGPGQGRQAVVIEADGRLCGLVAGRVGDLREIVVKRLDAVIGKPFGIGGTTILGEGRVVMILDPSSLASAGLLIEEAV